MKKAVNNIVWRILIFYIGSIFIILCIYPWNEVSYIGSPFVMTFAKVGISAAAGIINFVVLTAALSGCNSGMYSSGRMLYTLAQNGQAPKIFAKLSPTGVPRNSIAVTIVVLAIGVILNYLIPDSKLFLYLYSASVFPGMVAWFVLAYARFPQSLGTGSHGETSFQIAALPLFQLLLHHLPDSRHYRHDLQS